MSVQDPKTIEELNELHQRTIDNAQRTLATLRTLKDAGFTPAELSESDRWTAFVNASRAEAQRPEYYDDAVVEFPQVENDRTYEPDVEDVNLGAANAFWRGTSYKGYGQTRKTENFRDCWNISMDSEQLVHVQENNSGKLVRMWLAKTECECYDCRTLDFDEKAAEVTRNISARIRYNPRNCCWVVSVYLNRKNPHSARWVGELVADYKVHRTVTDEAELTVSKYVALEFARGLALA